MTYIDAIPELSPGDRHELAERIVSQDGVTYEQALMQIDKLIGESQNLGRVVTTAEATPPIVPS